MTDVHFEEVAFVDIPNAELSPLDMSTTSSQSLSSVYHVGRRTQGYVLIAQTSIRTRFIAGGRGVNTEASLRRATASIHSADNANKMVAKAGGLHVVLEFPGQRFGCGHEDSTPVRSLQ